MKTCIIVFISILLFVSCNLIPTPTDPEPPDIPENPLDLALGVGTYKFMDTLIYSETFSSNQNTIVNETVDNKKLTQMVWNNQHLIATNIFGQPLEDVFDLNLNFILQNNADPTIGIYEVDSTFFFRINTLSSISGSLEIHDIDLEEGGFIIATFEGGLIDSPLFNGQDTVIYEVHEGMIHLPIHYE